MAGIAKIRAFAVASACAALLAACTPQVAKHGYTPPDDDLLQIVPGVDSRASVEDLIGVPTTSGVLNDSGFYYVESLVQAVGPFRPKVVDREVVAIRFDEAGVVTGIERYGLQDGRIVPLVRRVTVSGDGDISFIRKLFGNIGGISAEQFLGDN